MSLIRRGYVAVLLCLIAFGAAIWGINQHIQKNIDVPEVRIGVSLTPLASPFLIAEHLGLFEKQGLKVSLFPCASSIACTQLMLSRDVEYATASDSVVMFQSFSSYIDLYAATAWMLSLTRNAGADGNLRQRRRIVRTRITNDAHGRVVSIHDAMVRLIRAPLPAGPAPFRPRRNPSNAGGGSCRPASVRAPRCWRIASDRYRARRCRGNGRRKSSAAENRRCPGAR